MVTTEEVIKCFEECYSKHYSQPDFSLSLNKSSSTIINKFLEYVNKNNCDNNMVYEFTVFNFQRYEGIKSSRKIQISWIYGKNAISSYQKRTEEQLYYTNQYKTRLSLNNPFKEKYTLKLNDYFKETERRRWYGTIQGFLNCIEFGSALYDEMCRTCIDCIYNKKCQINKERRKLCQV